MAIMIMRSIFTEASVQLHFLCFCFHSVILFFVFLFFVLFFCFLHHCHCETTPLREDIITHTSGVTSHYIVLHPVSSRASRTSGLSILGLSTVAISDSMLAKDVTLDCSKAYICFVHRS